MNMVMIGMSVNLRVGPIQSGLIIVLFEQVLKPLTKIILGLQQSENKFCIINQLAQDYLQSWFVVFDAQDEIQSLKVQYGFQRHLTSTFS